MRLYPWSIGLLLAVPLALAGCSGDAPDSAATAAPEQAAQARDDAMAPTPVMGPERRILAFGDSLFAGYGLDRTQSYPSRLEAALRARGVNAVIANAGVSGDTTAAGLQRLKFTLDAQEKPPELAILELGGNDLLRGLSPEQSKVNLAAMLDEFAARHIPVLLVGMRAPPNMGPEFQAQFDAIYPALAKQYRVPLVPFFLEPVYDKPALIQSDHIHPTAEGVEALVGATVDQIQQALPPAPKS
ncbi:MAG: arylesterase [Sphingomonadales bacterium]|nr:arylesterase [Sphingomonadales bacterium]MBD3772526.1 arylesterase [Paracoccaceae bacterium]